VDELFAHPRHPYTRGLLASIPRLTTTRKTRLPVIEGMVPGLSELPPGCRFQNRCPHAQPRCAERPPPIETVTAGHEVACLRWREVQSAEGNGAKP
jgi:peptide/nickel transport system ATP-binding protein